MDNPFEQVPSDGPDFTNPLVIGDHMVLMLTFNQAYNLWHGANCALDAGVMKQRGNHAEDCEETVREIVQELAGPLDKLANKILQMSGEFQEAKKRGVEHTPPPQVMN